MAAPESLTVTSTSSAQDSESETGHPLHSSPMDRSCTEDDFDLDSTEQIEEMRRVGTLAERFSLMKFKPFQKDVITHCLNGKDAIVIQPTGSGKSLCYQFPAIYTGKTATPTISLMMDQVHFPWISTA